MGYLLKVEKLGCGLVVSAKAGLARLAPQWSALLRAKLGCLSHPPRSTVRVPAVEVRAGLNQENILEREKGRGQD